MIEVLDAGIIPPPVAPPRFAGTCRTCGCVVVCDESDAIPGLHNYPWMGYNFLTKCPTDGCHARIKCHYLFDLQWLANKGYIQ